MAIVAYDDVQETTNTAGAGDLVFAGAVAGYRTVAGAGCVDKDQFSYSVRDTAGGTDFESGIGQYNSGANSLTRLEVTASSNAGAKVVFSGNPKVVYITVLAKQIQPIGAYPWTSATGLMGRYNALLSQSDLTSAVPHMYTKKWYDLSGNARHTDVNTTNPPKWSPRGFGGLPGWYFNFNRKMTISAMPQVASPFKATIIIVGSHFEAGGNSHVYNWAGNPIGFGATTPLDYMYNGTLPTFHATVQSILQDDRPVGTPTTHPVIAIHSYDAGNSINAVNGYDTALASPGTSASGTTNYLTIGSDSSSGIGGGTAQTCRMLLFEIAFFSFPMVMADRILANRYYRSLIPGMMTFY